MTDTGRGIPVSTLRLLAVFAITLTASGVAWAQSGRDAIDIPAMLGKTRAEMASVFPGTTLRLEGWGGWKEVMLTPGRDGRLVAVKLEPRASIPETEAEDAVRRCGITVDAAKYFAGAVERGYSDMTGRIKTVIYDLDSDGLVRAIRIHAARADAEP